MSITTIPDQHYLVYPSTAKAWLAHFLNMSGIYENGGAPQFVDLYDACGEQVVNAIEADWRLDDIRQMGLLISITSRPDRRKPNSIEVGMGTEWVPLVKLAA